MAISHRIPDKTDPRQAVTAEPIRTIQESIPHMAAPKTPKALLISQMLDQLKSAFPDVADLPRLEMVESVIFAILRENRNSAEALASIARFKSDYEDDYNELRVSGLREILRKIGPASDAEARAREIRRFLHQIFDKNYKFQIDGLAKKPFKEARDDLKDYEALANDHHMAYVQVQSLGGHAFPVDARILETARRLGVVDPAADAATLRGLLEKNIPKAQIHHAIALVERFVNEVCLAVAPRCNDCPFQKICPFHLGLTQGGKPSRTVESPASPKPKTQKSAPAAASVIEKKAKPAASSEPVAAAKSGKSAKDIPAAQIASIPKTKAAADKPAAKSPPAQTAAPKKSASTELPPVVAPEKPAAKPQSSKPAKAALVVESKPAKAASNDVKSPAKINEHSAKKPEGKTAAATVKEPAPKPAAAVKPASRAAKPAPKKGKKS